MVFTFFFFQILTSHKKYEKLYLAEKRIYTLAIKKFALKNIFMRTHMTSVLEMQVFQCMHIPFSQHNFLINKNIYFNLEKYILQTKPLVFYSYRYCLKIMYICYLDKFRYLNQISRYMCVCFINLYTQFKYFKDRCRFHKKVINRAVILVKT